MKKRTVEILAPVGSFDSLQAAINAGADAIYFGVEQLNMRSRSANVFSVTDIKKISEACKAAGIKAYLTLNTVMYDHDRQLLRSLIQEAKKQHIDAVIAADFAVIAYCEELEMPLHISTQANITNIETVQFFAAFADVIVLARELTLKQVAQIVADIKRKNITGPSGELVKIEIFVHGALCMAVSGKCYLSLHQQNASANRGACTQNCRRSYLVKDADSGEELLIENEYIMSPKDLCTIDILDEVIQAGVSVLKIEGRPKGADYVHTVTQCYREAADAVAEGNFTAEKIAVWKTALEKVYNRGFWEGYYLGRKTGEWTTQPGSAATEKKVYIGKGSRYYPQKKVGEFMIESGSVKIGDTLLITGPVCGMVKEKLEMLYVNGVEAVKADKGDKITFLFPVKVTAADKLYKIVDTSHA